MRRIDTATNSGIGGRVLLLFLLFSLALYTFKTSGLNMFAVVFGGVPAGLLAAYYIFKYRMITFWMLFIVNYTIMFITRFVNIGLPASLPNEMIEILLIVLAIIDAKDMKMERVANIMFLMLLIWCAYCILEIANNTCDLGFNVGLWYQGIRLISFQLIYAFAVCAIYIYKPQDLSKFLFFWGGCILFSTFWVFKQKYIGMTESEKAWLAESKTHNLSTGIRYWSIFTDAANFGCHMGAAATAFFIAAITTKIKKHRKYFLAVGIAATWCMFTSGTRTAIFCMIAGFAVYMVLARSFKIIIPTATIFGLFISFLAFTNIANGNQMIRRMRSGFKAGDASTNARSMNQATLRKYLRDAPWGLGIGMNYDKVPPGNKYKFAATVPPDSEYVYIWVHTGWIGLTIFLFTTFVMLTGACWTVMFRVKNRALGGIGAGFCCAFVGIQLGGYGNQILMQFPNVLVFYGGLSLVYCLPRIEPEWEKYEAKLLAEQTEQERIKLEKERAKRV